MINGLKIENKKRNREVLFEMKVLVIYVQINQLSIELVHVEFSILLTLQTNFEPQTKCERKRLHRTCDLWETQFYWTS